MAVERNIDVRIRLKGADQFKRGMKDVNVTLGKTTDWLDITKGILASNIVQKFWHMIPDALNACADASIAFESAMAGVAKTTDLSQVELDAMADEIKALSTVIPLAATEIARLVEAGGQLGIEKENLVEFAEVMANLGVATNLTAEEAAESFAKLANIMQTSADNYERMGSVVVALGNNMATTESDIVAMATRMASTASVVGLTEQEVFALAATMSSLGIEAEAGGSAISKLLKMIETNVATGSGSLEEFARISGLSAKDFSEAWQEEPVRALDMFLTGLGKIDETGGNAITTLADLGITEVRLSNAVLAMAGSNGLLTDALELANTAWAENTALAKEAETRYKTTESQITIFKNSALNLATAVGDRLNPLINNVLTFGTDITQWLTEIAEGENTLNGMINKADKQYADTSDSLLATADQAAALIDRLSQLEGKATLTASEQNEWNATLERLTELLPETSALINLQTGTINGGTEALRANTQATIENALEMAKQTAMQEKYEAYNKAIADQAERMVELTLAKNEATDTLERYNQMVAKSAELEAAAAEEAERLTKETGIPFLSGNILQRSQEYQKLQTELIDTAQAAYDAESEVADLEKQIANTQAEIDAATEEINTYKEVLDAANESVVSAAAGQKTYAEEVGKGQNSVVTGLQDVNATLDAAIAKYQEAEIEILDTINGIADGFSEITMPEIADADETIKNMETQLEYLDAYSEAIKKAQEMGVAGGIIAQLSTGDIASYQVLASIVSGTEEDVETINAKYAEISAAKTTLAEELATAQTDMASTVNSVTDLANQLVDGVDVSTDMYAAGAEDIQNLIDGINSKINALRLTTGRVHNITSAMSGTPDIDGSHAAGLAYVPHDGYIAQLHKGEMVLTALAAKAYRAEQTAGYAIPAAMDRVSGRTSYSTTNNYTNNISGIGASGEELDADLLAEKIARANRRKARGRGYT